MRAPGGEPSPIRLIDPHGGPLQERVAPAEERDDLRAEAATLPTARLTFRQLSDLDMLASGAMSPLIGFLGREDYESVIDRTRLASDVVWPLPITLATELPRADRICLADAAGHPLAIMDVDEAFALDHEREAIGVYGTDDAAHPGVAALLRQPRRALAGPITVFERPAPAFPDRTLDPAETRRIFVERGWRRVVGFQTRNPIHRAHEYLTKCALELVDGLLIHPLVGETKPGEIPPEVRLRCYEALLEHYYPAAHTLLAVYPAAMRYAGPREALFHAITRRNYGCTHFIVGRDHAGVGDYYDTYAAQDVFDRFDAAELGIEPLRYDQVFWCNGIGGMASEKTSPFGEEQRVTLSGTRVRQMLADGERPPREFSRPEVADILIEWARSTAGEGLG
jgi:sulfate adenylyltransferase